MAPLRLLDFDGADYGAGKLPKEAIAKFSAKATSPSVPDA
jgi:hypothetical protein